MSIFAGIIGALLIIAGTVFLFGETCGGWAALILGSFLLFAGIEGHEGIS